MSGLPNGPWWAREGFTGPALGLDTGRYGSRPRLVDDGSATIVARILDRRGAYTPTWTDDSGADAGQAMSRLYGELTGPVARQLNRLPDKAFVEFMRSAGVTPTPALAATAMVEFTVSAAATDASVTIPRRFQVGASAADDSGGIVTFETRDDLNATAASLDRIVSYRAAIPLDVTGANEDVESSYEPFGSEPAPNDAVLIGLSANATPTTSLTLGVLVAAASGSPPPASDGGVLPTPSPTSVVLHWEAMNGGTFEPVEVLTDETSNLTRSGLVRLRLPRGWQAEPLVNAGDDTPRFWIRLRLVYGSFDAPPQLRSLRLNAARVDAVQTYRDEVLEPVDIRDPREFFVRHAPVVPGSMTIEVDSEPLASTGTDDEGVTRWTEVDDLRDHGPDDRVFTVDHATGLVTFGDGEHHGAAVPIGFRNVRATSYQKATGAAGAVDDGDISQLLSSAPFVTGVTNPLATSGGTDRATDEEAIRLGPSMIRAGGRAVTRSDVAYLATLAPGADVARAHAVTGLHPLFKGAPIPGVIGVFIVPVPAASVTGPPVPDEAALEAVATFLADKTGPAGVEIVVSAPTYRSVRTEVEFQAAATTDSSQLIQDIIDALDTYFDPLTGGDQGVGWAFGGTIHHARVMQTLLRLDAVLAVPTLRLIVDGVRLDNCADATIGANDLIWPAGHEVLPVFEEASS